MDLSQAFKPTRKVSPAFYNKVFGLFGLAMAVTGLGVYAGYTFLAPVIFSSVIIFYGLIAIELGLILTSRWWAKTEGLNYFLFSLFTFLSGLTVVPIVASFAMEFGGYAIIARALFATTTLFLAAGAVGYSIKKPLTGLYGFLFMALIGMIIIAILGIFFPWGNTMELIYSGAGILLFAAFAVVDINRLAYFKEDEYIHAAIALYLDIFNLFLYILRFMGALNRR